MQEKVECPLGDAAVTAESGHEPAFAATFDSSPKQTLLQRFSTITSVA